MLRSIFSSTATWRMVSPKRANFAPCKSCHARAARIHAASRSCTFGARSAAEACWCIHATISCGVPDGANTPYHCADS